MKKILLIILFLVGGISFAQAQECQVEGIDGFGQQIVINSPCSSGQICVLPAQGVAPSYPRSGKCGTQAEQDFQNTLFVPTIAGGNKNENNKDKNTSKKETSKKGPCEETYIPLTTTRNPVISWQNIMAQYMNRPAPQKAYPLPPGPTTNGFSAGAGIVAGDECRFIYNDAMTKFSECTNAYDNDKRWEPQNRNKDGIWLTIPIANAMREKAAALCMRTNKITDADRRPIGKTCDKRASVFDALWGFLTHRKPY